MPGFSFRKLCYQRNGRVIKISASQVENYRKQNVYFQCQGISNRVSRFCDNLVFKGAVSRTPFEWTCSMDKIVFKSLHIKANAKVSFLLHDLC